MKTGADGCHRRPHEDNEDRQGGDEDNEGPRLIGRWLACTDLEGPERWVAVCVTAAAGTGVDLPLALVTDTALALVHRKVGVLPHFPALPLYVMDCLVYQGRAEAWATFCLARDAVTSGHVRGGTVCVCVCVVHACMPPGKEMDELGQIWCQSVESQSQLPRAYACAHVCRGTPPGPLGTLLDQLAIHNHPLESPPHVRRVVVRLMGWLAYVHRRFATVGIDMCLDEEESEADDETGEVRGRSRAGVHHPWLPPPPRLFFCGGRANERGTRPAAVHPATAAVPRAAGRQRSFPGRGCVGRHALGPAAGDVVRRAHAGTGLHRLLRGGPPRTTTGVHADHPGECRTRASVRRGARRHAAPQGRPPRRQTHTKKNHHNAMKLERP